MRETASPMEKEALVVQKTFKLNLKEVTALRKMEEGKYNGAKGLEQAIS